MDKRMNINIWIINLEKKDIIVGQDWLNTMKLVINWTIRELELNQTEIEKISDWLEDLVQVFEKFPDKRLSLIRPEMDHEINLIQESILSVLLISEKPQDHEIVKAYLDKILKKE